MYGCRTLRDCRIHTFVRRNLTHAVSSFRVSCNNVEFMAACRTTREAAMLLLSLTCAERGINACKADDSSGRSLAGGVVGIVYDKFPTAYMKSLLCKHTNHASTLYPPRAWHVYNLLDASILFPFI